MKTILYIILIIGVLIFAIGAFFLAEAEKRARKEEERLYNEIKEAERKKAAEAAQIITEANKTKADASTGDTKRDFNYMASKLHDLANQ